MFATAPLGDFFDWFGAKTIEELRVDFTDVRDHGADHCAGFVGRVAGGAHAPQAMKHDAGNGVHHGCEGRHRQDVTGDFDGALFRRPFYFLRAFGMGHRTDVPDVTQNRACVGDQQRR